ncbi:MAG: serine/threonine-protein kinase, partial [Chloroflexota bacterium]
PSPSSPPTIMPAVISSYETVLGDNQETLYGEPLEQDSVTRADIIASDVMSDMTRTIDPDNNIYQSVEMQNDVFVDGETRADDDLPIPYTDDSLIKQGISEDDAPKVATKTITQHEFDVRDMIENRYEVVDVKLGGMGVVYLCYDHDYREPVAIKSFQQRFLDNEKAVARFDQEAATWITLDKHPNIVQARLVRTIIGRPHIILEHISGMETMGADLRNWIESRRLTLKQAMTFALHIALGMQHAQNKSPGLVHRDLKPGNILVNHEAMAKITDFGLVRSVDRDQLPVTEDIDTRHESSIIDERLTRMDAVVGTPPYMAPEQILTRNVDLRADIYSFGIVLYEMLCWRHPFVAHGVKEWRNAHLNIEARFPDETPFALPSSIQALTLLCLEKERRNRPQSWDDVVAMLNRVYQEEFNEQPTLEYDNTSLEARELVNKGYSLTELMRYEDALEAYNQAIELDPSYGWAWGRKGRTLRLLERYDEALSCYDKALEIYPQDAWSWNGKGIVLERLGRYQDALAHYDRATAIEPSYVWYWFNRGGALKELGKLNEAIDMIKHALAIDPQHFNSHAKLGQIYRVQGNLRQSLKAYEKAIDIQPDYGWAHNGYGLT